MKNIIELKNEIERVKKEKYAAVEMQHWEEAANLRSLEIELMEELIVTEELQEKKYEKDKSV